MARNVRLLRSCSPPTRRPCARRSRRPGPGSTSAPSPSRPSPAGVRRDRRRRRQGGLRGLRGRDVPARARPAPTGTVATEKSPFGFALDVSYPRVAPAGVDDAARRALAGMKAFRDAGIEARGRRLPGDPAPAARPVFELANAVQHTSGQAFVMAFQAGGAHALDRALEAIAYAYAEMTRVPATAIWEKPGQGRADADGEDVHRRAARRRAGDRLQHLPDLELLARPVRLAGLRQPGRRQAAPRRRAAAGHHGAGVPARCWPRPASTPTWSRSRPRTPPTGWPQVLAVRPEVKLIDFTGGNAFGDWLEEQRPPGDGLHREGRRQHGRGRLDRLLQGDVLQPGVLVRALHRPDVHRAAEPLHPARRHRRPTRRTSRSAEVAAGIDGGARQAPRRRRPRGRAARRRGQRRRARAARRAPARRRRRAGRVPGGAAPGVRRRRRPHATLVGLDRRRTPTSTSRSASARWPT